MPSGPKFSSSVTKVKVILELKFGNSFLKFFARYKWTAALDLQLTEPRPVEYFFLISNLNGLEFHSSRIGLTVSICELKTNDFSKPL